MCTIALGGFLLINEHLSGFITKVMTENVLCFLFNAQCCFKSAPKFGPVGCPAAPSPVAALSCEAPEVLMLSSDVLLQI